jgi:hypothetical protein
MVRACKDRQGIVFSGFLPVLGESVRPTVIGDLKLEG